MNDLEQRVSTIVERVLKELMIEGQLSPAAKAFSAAPPPPASSPSDLGIFQEVAPAMEAALNAQSHFMALSLEKRKNIIDAMRDAALKNSERLARMAWEETGLGRFEDKIQKNKFAATLTPGVEDLEIEVHNGPMETVVVDYGPYGLSLSITPITNPTSTIINHSISLLAAGNSVFFAPHPGSKKCVQETIRILNQAIIDSGGPANMIVTVVEPSLENVELALKTDEVKLVIATGGAALVKAALAAGKKCVAGGPGNPPVIIDETADLTEAAQGIVEGASFDNNILCISEKVLIALNIVADDLLKALQQRSAVVLNSSEAEALTKVLIEDGHINKKFVGKNPSVILSAIGKRVSDDVRLVVMETAQDHPLVELEQLMPVLPLVRVGCFEEAVKLAKKVEGGHRHTAAIYSRDMQRVNYFAKQMHVTLLLHNKPSIAGLGTRGAGKYTSTLAGPTGEGVTTAKTFARQLRYVAPNYVF